MQKLDSLTSMEHANRLDGANNRKVIEVESINVPEMLDDYIGKTNDRFQQALLDLAGAQREVKREIDLAKKPYEVFIHTALGLSIALDMSREGDVRAGLISKEKQSTANIFLDMAQRSYVTNEVDKVKKSEDGEARDRYKSQIAGMKKMMQISLADSSDPHAKMVSQRLETLMR